MGSLFIASLSALVLGLAFLVGGWFHHHRAVPTVAWFNDSDAVLVHHLTAVVGMGSVAWAGHLIHVAISTDGYSDWELSSSDLTRHIITQPNIGLKLVWHFTRTLDLGSLGTISILLTHQYISLHTRSDELSHKYIRPDTWIYDFGPLLDQPRRVARALGYIAQLEVFITSGAISEKAANLAEQLEHLVEGDE